MDNVGFWLIEKKRIKSGNFLIGAMPKLIKTLAFVGTFAMILVGGGILSHKIEFFHNFYIEALPALVNDLLIGLVIGAVVLPVVNIIKKMFSKA